MILYTAVYYRGSTSVIIDFHSTIRCAIDLTPLIEPSPAAVQECIDSIQIMHFFVSPNSIRIICSRCPRPTDRYSSTHLKHAITTKNTIHRKPLPHCHPTVMSSHKKETPYHMIPKPKNTYTSSTRFSTQSLDTYVRPHSMVSIYSPI